MMNGTRARKALLATVGSLILAGCGTTGPSANADPSASRAAVPATTVAAAPATTAAAAAGGGGLTACALITPQDASTALGKTVGPGTAGGAAALSECIYDDGALIIGMKTDSKALYDKSYADARAKGATDEPGVGDSAFAAGDHADRSCTLELLKGTTLVSILLGGSGAHDTAVAIAKTAASKL
jgi:hypothetical protein